MILRVVPFFPWYNVVVHLPNPVGSCGGDGSTLCESWFIDKMAVPPGWNLAVDRSCEL